MTRQIGGIYQDRSMAGQNGAEKPFLPVDYKTQKNAMKALAKYAFAPNAFNFPAETYNYLQRQRRGYTHFSVNEDPRLHDRYLNIHKDLLNHLTHQNVMKRITDSQLYGNSYTLPEMMGDLTDAIFKADLTGQVNTIRQNLQHEYIDRLASIISDKSSYDNISQSVAFAELKKIQRSEMTASSPDASTKAHRQYILHKIEKALDED